MITQLVLLSTKLTHPTAHIFKWWKILIAGRHTNTVQCSTVKNHDARPNFFIYFFLFVLLPISLHFFCVLSSFISLQDPDPGGSGFTALKNSLPTTHLDIPEKWELLRNCGQSGETSWWRWRSQPSGWWRSTEN